MKDERYELYSKTKIVYRLISNWTGATMPFGTGFTDWELKEAIFEVLAGVRTKKTALKEYGVTDNAYKTYSAHVLSMLGKKNAAEVRKELALQNIRKRHIRDTVESIKRKKMGRKCLFSSAEEAVLVANIEMKNMHGCGNGKKKLSTDIAEILGQVHPKELKADSYRRMAKRMLKR
eukprot:14831708-Ditylum_brightwellii.AAC.1